MKSLNFNYLEKLDHLRFFAALLVIYHHFRGYIVSSDALNFERFDFITIVKLWLVKGSSGVSLFLVLSAFLFTLILNGGTKKIYYWKFIYNRVLRIFPLLILMIFIVITINRSNSTPIDILRIITLQLNTGNSLTGWGHDIFPIGPIWTIAVEFQFYLLFPFLIFFSYKYGFKYIFLILSLMIIIRFGILKLTSPDIYYNLYHTIIGRLDQFIIGILLGILYINRKLIWRNNIYSIILLILSLLCLTYVFYLGLNIQRSFFSSVISFPLEALFWGGVIIGYLNINFTNTLLTNFGKIVAFLGGLSFSIYLLHLPIGIVVGNMLSLPEPNSLLQSVYYTSIRLIFILGISIISFYAIEKPFMDLRVKYFKE